MTDIDDFSRRPRPPIVLTFEDRERLLALKDSALEEMPDVVRFLMEELERADIIATSTAVASSLVTMGSVVKFIDHEIDKIQQGRLVYPDEVSDGRGLISVLTPTGSVLLGLGPGQSMSWTDGSGETRCVTVLEVHPPSERCD